MAGGIKVRIVKKAPLMEAEPIETEAQRKSRIRRNRSKTPRQKKDYPSDDPRHMSRNEKLDILFPGHSELRRLSKGIAENKKPISKKTGKREMCLGHNPNHRGSDGRFSDGSDSGGSWSSGQTSSYAASKEAKTGCDRGQTRRSGKVRKWTKVKCGRPSREEGKRNKDGRKTWVRCKDGQRVVWEDIVNEDSLKLPTTDVDKLTQVDLDALISQLRAKKDRILKLTKSLELLQKAKCKGKRGMSVGDLATAINAVELAQKGKLNAPD